MYTGKWVNGEAIKGVLNHPGGPVEKVSDEPVREQSVQQAAMPAPKPTPTQEPALKL